MGILRTAVVGAGKMGALHARVYSQLPDSRLTAVVDTDAARAHSLAQQYGCEALTDPKDLLGRVDAVTISTPTAAHYPLAKLFLENRIPVLIEKPLASTVEEGRQIVELARRTQTVVAVGHSERCNPVVQAMKRLKIEPRFIEADRVSPYPFRSSDVGVVLDVMIHDIDIILSLARSPVCQVEAVGVNVIADHEDICNARLIFENGCIANITASRLALKTERKVRVFSRQAYLSVDYFRKEGIIIKTDPNIDVISWIRERQKAGDFDFSQVKWTELLQIEHLDITESEPLRVEQEAFLRAVLNPGQRPEVTAEEGLAALECADRILQKVRQHRWNP
ncbi:MAG TPA: Gfo/Idh/MocA family oxidoreductase [Anaerohalosphaeraceae bacterium]|nr:Gfo/Idh/MocA family oxidoreductase [Anaerohalosphaeraceae bacterium]HOT73084.1 Gfo/Idh/MocA family oxidoreductase [Anaerohalosphaeraceae bacterium]HPB92694.1 Gfo/Idh/MocA family oxidoreductase [Anaerohalosphaeraceae bacterium]HQG06275.1 Gfo/Idh/MocA family oxidoreductase [Anaerohalosphaeraceae bacterium]HQI07666.1 Gfo/Idh/MocA family oxidoreductase [Anaerohalosphaeraceae bacterium]